MVCTGRKGKTLAAIKLKINRSRTVLTQHEKFIFMHLAFKKTKNFKKFYREMNKQSWIFFIFVVKVYIKCKTFEQLHLVIQCYGLMLSLSLNIDFCKQNIYMYLQVGSTVFENWIRNRADKQYFD